MNSIYWRFRNFEFQDGDPDYGCFKRLVELQNNKKLEEIDVEIISSMLKLHHELAPLSEILFTNGFILPKNERELSGDVEALWKFVKDGKDLKIVTYTSEDWFTMWNRSDHYHVSIEYKTENVLSASYRYIMSETDYGRQKTHEKHCMVKKGDDVIINYIKPFPT